MSAKADDQVDDHTDDLVVLPDVMPERRRDLEVAVFAAEYVVFDPHQRLSHLLGNWQAVVFEACDGSSDPEELAEAAIAYWHGDADEARYRLAESLNAFDSIGLLEGSVFEEPPPCIDCGGPQSPKRRWWRVRR